MNERGNKPWCHAHPHKLCCDARTHEQKHKKPPTHKTQHPTPTTYLYLSLEEFLTSFWIEDRFTFSLVWKGIAIPAQRSVVSSHLARERTKISTTKMKTFSFQFNLLLVSCTLFLVSISPAESFSPLQPSLTQRYLASTQPFSTVFAENSDDGIVELGEEPKTAETEDDAPVAPFLSQGEISEEAMTMDFSDPKQARVMVYIILSLLPVLFLIPLMLGSRDLIPLDALPPVELN